MHLWMKLLGLWRVLVLLLRRLLRRLLLLLLRVMAAHRWTRDLLCRGRRRLLCRINIFIHLLPHVPGLVQVLAVLGSLMGLVHHLRHW
jgi:hypothetical protein